MFPKSTALSQPTLLTNFALALHKKGANAKRFSKTKFLPIYLIWLVILIAKVLHERTKIMIKDKAAADLLQFCNDPQEDFSKSLLHCKKCLTLLTDKIAY